jgi:hypothetical protein
LVTNNEIKNIIKYINILIIIDSFALLIKDWKKKARAKTFNENKKNMKKNTI